MIKAKRFIDEFRPGDNIPKGRYDDETLSKMASKNQVEIPPVNDDPVTPEPIPVTKVVKTPRTRKAK